MVDKSQVTCFVLRPKDSSPVASLINVATGTIWSADLDLSQQQADLVGSQAEQSRSTSRLEPAPLAYLGRKKPPSTEAGRPWQT